MEGRKIKSMLLILRVKVYRRVRREGNQSDLVEHAQLLFFRFD